MSMCRSILLLHRQKLRSILPNPILSSQLPIAPDTTLHHQRFLNNNHRQCYHHQHFRFFSSVTPNYFQAENSSSSSSQRMSFSSETLLITETGKTRLRQIVNSSDGTYLRICVEGGGCSGFQYKFNIENSQLAEDDIVLSESDSEEAGRVVIDKTSLDILKGSTIDYETELIRSAFRIVSIPLAEQGCSCGASFNVKID